MQMGQSGSVVGEREGRVVRVVRKAVRVVAGPMGLLCGGGDGGVEDMVRRIGEEVGGVSVRRLSGACSWWTREERCGIGERGLLSA